MRTSGWQLLPEGGSRPRRPATVVPTQLRDAFALAMPPLPQGGLSCSELPDLPLCSFRPGQFRWAASMVGGGR
jgi:hypothetical protein